MPEPPKQEQEDLGDIRSFVWKGQTRYQCPRKWDSGTECVYDTYDLDLMRDHISKTHGVEIKRATATDSGRFDRPASEENKGAQFKKTE